MKKIFTLMSLIACAGAFAAPYLRFHVICDNIEGNISMNGALPPGTIVGKTSVNKTKTTIFKVITVPVTKSEEKINFGVLISGDGKARIEATALDIAEGGKTAGTWLLVDQIFFGGKAVRSKAASGAYYVKGVRRFPNPNQKNVFAEYTPVKDGEQITISCRARTVSPKTMKELDALDAKNKAERAAKAKQAAPAK